MENLSKRSNLPWVCMGDFNEIMHAKEKEGGGARPGGQMQAFRGAINKSQLRDLGYVGSDFTWSRRLGCRGWVRERLDRALVSTNWDESFPAARLFHVATSVSDHSILVLKETTHPRKHMQRTKVWRFESMWLEDVRCKEVVQGAWDMGKSRGSSWPLETCIEECQVSLKNWNKQTFGHVGKQVAELQRRIQALESMKGDNTILETVHATKKELNRWLGIEEEMWH